MLIKLLPAVPELYLRLALTYEAISQAGRPANMVVRFSHIPGFRASHHGFAIFLEEPLPRLIDRLPRNSWLLGRHGDGGDLVSEAGGFPLELVNLQFSVFKFVDGRSLVDVFHAVAQHAIDQAG